MIKKIARWALIVLGVLILAGQAIRPPKNISANAEKDISTLYPVPDSVQAILRVACYDCHSNATRYPWYAEIQPAGWMLYKHIEDGKRDLNFSEFASYRIRRQYRRLEQMKELVEKNEMPLSSYTMIHRDAVLTDGQKQTLFAWVKSTRDSIEAHTPADSLKSNRKR